jgi:hypothetical protein
MRRSVIGVAFVAIIGGIFAAGSTPVGATAGIQTHQATVRLAGTVNVASLPRAAGHTAESGPLAAAATQAPQLSIAAGIQLTPALKNSDNTGRLTPPDMGVGADATHVVQMVNDVGKIWTNHVAGSAFQLSAFFLSGSDFISDPWVLFDQESGRWFAGIGDFTSNGTHGAGEKIAVSKTGDPTGTWVVYTIGYPSTHVTGGGCPDQSKAGVDSNVLGLGFNEFSGVGCTGSFLGAALEVFNKSQMIAGASVNFAYTDPIASYFSLVPAQALSAGATTLYFASNDLNSTSRKLHRVTSVGVPPTLPTLTALADLTLAHTYPAPPQAPQKGTGTPLNSGDQRMQHVVWKAGVGLVMTWSESCKPATDTAQRDCGRVIATNDGVGGPAVTMDKELSKKAQYYVYPAATLNSANDVVADFEVTSGTIYPQLDAAAAKVGLAFGTTLVLVPGTAGNTTGRYGDYSAVALDPSGATPNKNVWAAGEIGQPGPGTWPWATGVREVNVTP